MRMSPMTPGPLEARKNVKQIAVLRVELNLVCGADWRLQQIAIVPLIGAG
jgi:hypothetical protein